MGKPSEAQASNNSLTVRDNRTGKVYNVPISATEFKAMSASRIPGEREENETEKGLRVSDRGFLNTAVMRSTITYIDGEAGAWHTVSAKVETLLPLPQDSAIPARASPWPIPISCPLTKFHLE
ncbi:hypothetical protein C0989_006379 [Termitomyces sp. Mn162]|nr:hypothetical protein C0989_006379 [Termitomyces sp. Mn162]